MGLWIDGQDLRAVFDTVVLATYPCRYDQRQGTVSDMRPGQFAVTRFASPQSALFTRTPHDSLILYRPPSSRRPVRASGPVRPLGLFA